MKKKKLKLVRLEPYSTVIAVLGGRSIDDAMPVMYGKTVVNPKTTTKPNTVTTIKSRIRRRYTNSEE